MDNVENDGAVSATSYDWFWDSLNRYLLSKQLKQTKQRRSIVEIFLSMKNHISAEELHEEVKRRGHNIGLATIYRTLNLLRAADLVEQQQFADGRAVFEVLQPGEHHDHIICTNCGKVVEFHNEEIERIQAAIAEEHGFVLTHHTHELYGICSNCRSKVTFPVKPS